MKRILSILFVLISATALMANNTQLVGQVTDSSGIPLTYALVITSDGVNYSYTTDDGHYSLNLPKGEYVITTRLVGYATHTFNISITEDIKQTHNIVLQQDVLSINEVVVRAESKESNAGTSVYQINEQAIKQIQAISLGDILTLLPGKKVGSNSLNSVQQADLRSASSSSINNFGTAVIVDGAAISNDGNMQASNPAASLGSGGAVVGQGIDLRTINASNIESVEVITGVASPKYGNINSGAIIVKNKVGKSPLTSSINLNPNAYQLILNKGFTIKNKGQLSTDFSYTYSNASPTDNKFYYNNFNGGIRWRMPLKEKINWYHTTSLQLRYSKNGQRADSDQLYKNTRDVKNHFVALNLNGKMDVLGKLNYTLASSVNHQHSEFFETRTDGPIPAVEASRTGTYYGSYTPLMYEQSQILKGLPININARIEADQAISFKQLQLTFNTGVQYTFDKNFGSGRTVNGAVAATFPTPASRNAKFHEVPASSIFSIYHETKIKRQGTTWAYQLRLGARYDNMYSKYNLVSPRLASEITFKKQLKLRAAWGISYKAPALIQLHPSPVYIDYTNLSHLDNNPLERLAIMSTYVYQPDNGHLKPMMGDTKEIGLDWMYKKWQIRTTAFKKELSDGINYNNHLVAIDRQNYEVVEEPIDQQPIVRPSDKTRLIRTINVMDNKRSSETYGFELTILPPKITATNTQLNFRFSRMRTREKDGGNDIRVQRYEVDDSGLRMGVYDETTRQYWLSNGSLTLAQHIPQLRLVFTVVSELNFSEYSEYLSANRYAKGYYDTNATYHHIPIEDRYSDEYQNLQLPENTYSQTDKPPFYTNFHLQVRKETKAGHSFSLYANNMFWQSTEYTVNSGRREITAPTTFGFSVSFKMGKI